MIGNCLRGIELRYALTLSKAISDALRWEVSRGRVVHQGRGRYGPGAVPRSTEYRIHQRVLALRQQASGRALPVLDWEEADWLHT